MPGFRPLTASAIVALLILHAARGDEPSFERDIRPILADKCFKCHGPDEAARQSGLRLDEREAALAEADSGAAAIVPGKPNESELVRRVLSDDVGERMPPEDAKLVLSEQEKQQLVAWIAAGAVYQQHWSLIPPRRPALPDVSDPAWPQNAIDYFVLAALDQRQLTPSSPADPYRLVRRVYLDLTGLPPTPQQADQFVQDTSPDAYERLVDRLLDAPAFGERMAWPWLDAARYADSNGYQGDAERTMWPWRDWVIRAWNHNLPFDEFTIWQLAGDRLPDATAEQQLATGFCRNHMINGEGGRIPEENRVDYVMDMSETMGTIWLGLTLNCCRCHDHKYDPLSRRDYYSLFAFFNQTPIDGSGGNPQTPPVLEVPSRQQQQQLQEVNEQRAKLVEQLTEHEKTLSGSEPTADISEEIAKILEAAPGDREQKHLEQLEKHFATSAADYAKLVTALRETNQRRNQVSGSIPRVMIMRDRDELRPTFMLDKGLYNQPGEQVAANVPGRLPPLAEANSTDRLALARWLMAEQHPLTARVTVNRVWQQFFGVGLVKTSEDFGTQGESPSHPELLDWLAVEYQQSGWDTKRLVRLLVTSAAYRQTSRVDAVRFEADPENRLVSRGARYRMPAWMLRDQALAVSGLLVTAQGGPPVHPYQPEGVWEDATFGKKSYPQDHGAKLYRRSVYTFWRRIIGPTMFFDSASRQVCTVKQPQTNTPLHALTTLNDVTYVEAARVLAESLLLEAGPQSMAEDQLDQLFRRIVVRPPTDAERMVLQQSLKRLRAQFAADPAAAEQLLSVGEQARAQQLDPHQVAPLAALANVLLNLDETLTRE